VVLSKEYEKKGSKRVWCRGLTFPPVKGKNAGSNPVTRVALQITARWSSGLGFRVFTPRGRRFESDTRYRE
jgi:hypothetical protein